MAISMSKIRLINTGHGLVPASEDDSTALGMIRLGQEVTATIRIHRSPGNHRRYFAFVRAAFDMQERYHSQEILRKALQVQAGWFDELIMPDERVCYMPRSIAWDDLDEPEFKELFGQVVQAYIDLFGQKLTPKQLDDIVRW